MNCFCQSLYEMRWRQGDFTVDFLLVSFFLCDHPKTLAIKYPPSLREMHFAIDLWCIDLIRSRQISSCNWVQPTSAIKTNIASLIMFTASNVMSRIQFAVFKQSANIAAVTAGHNSAHFMLRSLQNENSHFSAINYSCPVKWLLGAYLSVVFAFDAYKTRDKGKMVNFSSHHSTTSHRRPKTG